MVRMRFENDGRPLREQIIKLLSDSQTSVEEDLVALNQCVSHIRNQLIVMQTAKECGFKLSGFKADDDLELYYDLKQGRQDVGYISKGWEDPGLRVGDIIKVPKSSNSGMAGPPPADYLILDLEYQWAQRRLDMIAAKRRPTKDDAAGWAEPGLVFVEVKSELGACLHRSGLGDHARDYRDIIKAKDGLRDKEIKLEYENVIAQKTRLGLLAGSLGFKRFSHAVSELLVVFVDLNPNEPRLQVPLGEVRAVSDVLAHIRFMRLHSKNYVMTADNAVSLERLVAERT